MSNSTYDSDTKETFIIRSKYRDEKISVAELKKSHADFADKKPQLFAMICSSTCDDTMLNMIMREHSHVQSGHLNQHDASVNVGTALVDKYVRSRVETPHGV